jgi:mannose-6-phosphate isomerase-like protein (cupin superfamily)
MEFNAVRKVGKPWGRELIIASEDKYAGKILEVRKGRRLSLQYHRRKKETMYVLSGRIRLTVDGESISVGAGKSITLEPGAVHRVEALQDARIIEVSTTQLDDVVRLDDDHGRKADGRAPRKKAGTRRKKA